MSPIVAVRRRPLLGLLALAPALALPACAPRRGPAFEPLPADVAAVVDMRLLSFDPAEIRIAVGETVLWRNRSAFRHTVTADPERAQDPANVALPEGASPFDSGDIAPGEVFRHRFEIPGLYRYVCRPHEELGMLGRVVVAAAPPVG